MLDAGETHPVPGTWTVFVDGFTVWGKKEKSLLRVDW